MCVYVCLCFLHTPVHESVCVHCHRECYYDSWEWSMSISTCKDKESRCKESGGNDSQTHIRHTHTQTQLGTFVILSGFLSPRHVCVKDCAQRYAAHVWNRIS